MKRAALAIFILAACSKQPPAPPKPRPATLRGRANAWLVERQRADGSWKSDVYSGDGAAMTAFALFALTRAPDYPKVVVTRGLDWLRAHPIADDHPAYATALAIRAWCAAKPADWKDDVARRVKGLKSFQLSDENGWTPADPGYGGFDGGPAIPKKPMHGQVDISVTTFALEALKDAGEPLPESAFMFLQSCSVEEGFIFTPLPDLIFKNKAGPGVPYGTATLDGFEILKLFGRPTDAWRRLLENRREETPWGFPAEGEAADWPRGLRFYYAYARARTLGDRNVAEWLAKSERPGGGWQNDFALMKEDDPLIATGLAAAALNLLYSQSRGVAPK